MGNGCGGGGWMLMAMVMFVLDPDLLRSVADPALGGFGHRSWVLALQIRWLEGFRGNLLAGVAATPMAVPLGVASLVGGFGEDLLPSTPPRSSGENLRPPLFQATTTPRWHAPS